MARRYTKEEIKKIRESGKIAKEVIEILKERIEPGISAKRLDTIAYREITKYKDAEPSFLGYHGYPASICVSINEEVIHGIPYEEKIIKEGDIVDIDIGVRYRGYHSDTSYTICVGKVSEEAKRLVEVTYNALYSAIKKAIVGNRIGDIGYTIQMIAEKNGYNTVRNFTGHGVGLNVHEPPQVPCFGQPGRGEKLKSGMVIAIEPMINQGTSEVEILNDGWTVVTKDRKLSAHFEHTIAITNNGPLILTN